ncbi:hypothetical protein LBMAG56_48150 [Verrucomicrobiota bacterium]|nr:hypothetical protein LBMAG56_48150 [Verrucomicrobiota bacterium]
MTNELVTPPNNNDSLTANPAAAAPAPRAISRQRRWQIKMREEHRCWRCGEPAVGSLCLTHLAKERERQRRINGYSARHLNALSYAANGAAQPVLQQPLPAQAAQFSYEI